MCKKLILIFFMFFVLPKHIGLFAQEYIREVLEAPTIDGRIEAIEDRTSWGLVSSHPLRYYILRENEKPLEQNWEWSNEEWPGIDYADDPTQVSWRALWAGNKLYLLIEIYDSHWDFDHKRIYPDDINHRDEDDTIQLWFESNRNTPSFEWDWTYDYQNYLIHWSDNNHYYRQFENGRLERIPKDSDSKINFNIYKPPSNTCYIEVEIESSSGNDYSDFDYIRFNISYNDADNDKRKSPEGLNERWLRLAWRGGNVIKPGESEEKTPWQRLEKLVFQTVASDERLHALGKNSDAINYKKTVIWNEKSANIVIDGKLHEEEYKSAIPIVLASHRNPPLFEWKNWSMSKFYFKDAMVKWRALWDSEKRNLHFGFQIYDDFRQSSDLLERIPIDDDGILLMVDFDNNGVHDQTDINVLIHNEGSIYRYTGYDSITNHEKYDALYDREDIEVKIANIDLTNKDIKNWIAEVKIDIPEGVTINDTLLIGLEIGYNDADKSGIREHQLIWSATTAGYTPWENFVYLGEAHLSLEPPFNYEILIDDSDPTKVTNWGLPKSDSTYGYWYVGGDSFPMRWNPSTDGQSGIDDYQIVIGSDSIKMAALPNTRTIPDSILQIFLFNEYIGQKLGQWAGNFESWLIDSLTQGLVGNKTNNYFIKNLVTDAGKNFVNDTLYARIRALNGFDRLSVWSDLEKGIVIDTTAPSAPGIPISPVKYCSTETVVFNWTSAEEPESFVTDYHLQVINTKGDTRFDDWIGFALADTIRGFHADTLRARVRAKNVVGLIGPWSEYSEIVIIDLTPPTGPDSIFDFGTYTISRLVSFEWTEAFDKESEVFNYQLQVRASPGDSLLLNDWIGKVLTDTILGSANQTLFAKVRAQNGAKLIGEWSPESDGITIIPVDILFVFDLSSNMESHLNDMKEAASALIDSMDSIKADAHFGVASFIDYQATYNNYCDYSGDYGDENDYLWKAQHEISNDTVSVKKSIKALEPCSGKDKPQAYSRALLESLFLNWRPEARKFIVMIGNATPHDCDFFSQSYGNDPGPDTHNHTCDDLDYKTVVNWVDQTGFTIISIENKTPSGSGNDYVGDVWKNFEYMATATGGHHFMQATTQNLSEAITDTIASIVAKEGLKPDSLYPLVIEAEEMKNRVGNPCKDGWRLTHQNWPLYEGVVFLTDSIYHFTVTAKAEIDCGIAPWLKVQIGDDYTGTCEINSTEWKDYEFTVPITAGFHCLSLTYLNNRDTLSGDCNLLLDRVRINYHADSIATTHFTFEAEQMESQHKRNCKEQNYVVFPWRNCFVGQEMFFEKPALTFAVYAKADSVNGGWPQIKFTIDVEINNMMYSIIDTNFSVNDTTFKPYLIPVEALVSGKHKIKIRYHTDSYSDGRKLYVDKLVIHTGDGGLLKSGNQLITDDVSQVDIPNAFALAQNYPNPFNATTRIDYQLPEESHVVIKIINILGQEIATLINKNQPAGYYRVYWKGLNNQGNQAVSGVYFYQIEAGSFIRTKKMVLLR